MVRDVVLRLAPRVGLRSGHLPLGVQVGFVADDHEGEVVRVARVRLVKEFIAPILHRLEGLLYRDVIDQDATVGPAVEGHAQALESFLPSSVPNLQGHGLVVDRDLLGQEVGAMVALYWFENFLLTYWFINEVFPTPLSPKMMTFSSTFFLLEDAMAPGRRGEASRRSSL
eukprot:CAMPEP_0115441112 /NCGR_PEP_ID=MMETSP0271-20121206/36655_1 /TAXON_ID=71861 /ORGANISM="Scrippsiella trochoidea, Strain CCMP3099" /LENGTH=169 /DNA_ID=CAMNT_0002866887 /DNA_START=356 /DNA_END=863 /DNA_ORIENTATION=+